MATVYALSTLHPRLANALSSVLWCSAKRSAARFFSFAQTEAASEIDLRYAAMLTTSPDRRALYLQHALEEARHTRLFARSANELRRANGHPSLGTPLAHPEALYERLGERKFLAFVYRGEARGRKQFEGYRRYFARHNNKRFVALFDTVLKDERRHEHYCYSLLVHLSGSKREARRTLRSVALWEAWQRWRRLARSMAHPLYTVSMFALFLTIAPFAVLIRITQPEKSGWTHAPPPPRPTND